VSSPPPAERPQACPRAKLPDLHHPDVPSPPHLPSQSYHRPGGHLRHTGTTRRCRKSPGACTGRFRQTYARGSRRIRAALRSLALPKERGQSLLRVSSGSATTCQARMPWPDRAFGRRATRSGCAALYGLLGLEGSGTAGAGPGSPPRKLAAPASKADGLPAAIASTWPSLDARGQRVGWRGSHQARRQRRFLHRGRTQSLRARAKPRAVRAPDPTAKLERPVMAVPTVWERFSAAPLPSTFLSSRHAPLSQISKAPAGLRYSSGLFQLLARPASSRR
jgi:hypothetical protein